MSYPKKLPVDQSRTPMQDYPAAVLAQEQYSSENATASSVITLTDNTTQIEIGATNGAAVMRWVPRTETAGVAPAASVISAAANANFDHMIPANTFRKFVVPQEVGSTPSIVGANIKEGLYRRVAYKSVGVASVMLSEF